MARRIVRSNVAVAAALATLLLVPAATLAHPLGNFTVNHYAGIRVTPDLIALDVVIDSAEIPTVMARQRIDADGDGTVTDQEIENERQVACTRLAPALHLAIPRTPLALTIDAAGLSFPSGAGGLQTMRLVCEYSARPTSPMAAGLSVRFSDASYDGQIGWREIVVVGDRTTLAGDGVSATSVSDRLTRYPQELLSVPLDQRDVTLTVTPGGRAVPAPCLADAMSLSAAPGPASIGYGCAAAPAPAPATGQVPGGVGSEISALLQTQDLTPPIVILSLLTAMLLGAGHALTPGHGKTVMAAYLVGMRGTGRHALLLALTVTVSHTLGVLMLAAVILFLNVVTPEAFNHATGILSALLVMSIGMWLVWRQAVPVVRNWLSVVASRPVLAAAYAGRRGAVAGQSGGVVHAQAYDPHAERSHAGGHSHGGATHTHAFPTDTPLTWRSLFALGLFGGLVPSINALLILLATLATGRAAYGLVLVIAFGAGMAIVLGGIGFGLVYAARWMGRAPRGSAVGRAIEIAPAVTAGVILVIGIYLARQALLGAPTF